MNRVEFNKYNLIFTHLNRKKKKALYELHGVKEYRIADPHTRTWKSSRWRQPGLSNIAGFPTAGGQMVSTPIFPEMSFKLNELWQ